MEMAHRRAVRGLFVVLEGIDGAGKSTLAELLSAALSAEGTRWLHCADSRFGDAGAHARTLMRTRGQLLADVGPEPPLYREHMEACLQSFALDRQQLAARAIAPALEQGFGMICDRWEWSTWCYFSVLGMPTSLILKYLRGHPPSVYPDLVLWLRCSPERAALRARERISQANPPWPGWSELELDPCPAKLEQLAELDRRYAAIPGLTEIDANGSVDQTLTLASSAIRQVMACWFEGTLEPDP